MFKLTCAARGSCLVGPARQLFLADPHDDVTAGFPYIPAACEVWGALPTAGGSCTTAPGTAAGLAASRLLVEVPRGWCLLSFFPSAVSSSCLLSSWQHRQSPSRRGPGEVPMHLWLRVAAALQLGLAAGLWDQPGAQSDAGGAGRHAWVNCSSGFGAALVCQGHTMEA